MAVMVMNTLPSGALLLLVSIAGVLYFCYRKLVFRPIPGIPYNKNAAYTLLGDVPEVIKSFSKDGMIPWMASQTARHNSPIVQIFGRPFRKPWVLLADYRESQDIMLRRTREFDRSDFMGDVFVGITPAFHISMMSTDQEFKEHRGLLKDLMTPAFLHQVAAPQVHASVEHLMNLWSTKATIAEGHAFSAMNDILNTLLDSSTAIAFGLNIEEGVLTSQIQFLDNNPKPEIPRDENDPVNFDHVTRSPVYEALVNLVDSAEVAIKAPFPLLAHWIWRKMPAYRKSYRMKEAMLDEQLDRGVTRFEMGDMTERCALDNILKRELAAAQKQHRTPDYKSRAIKDELMGFLIGGYETTSTTMMWAFKDLSVYPAIQQHLRSLLREACPEAVREERNPTTDEITKLSIPYLDATIEEIHRSAKIAPSPVRKAMCDTTILGHHIPKGTDVWMTWMGPDFFTPPIPIDEEKRSESSRSAKLQVGSWDMADIQAFKPERWLKTDEKGQEYFDQQAGPHLAFGLGPRACFGRRLAYLQVRMMLVMAIWNFELLPVSGECGSLKRVEKITVAPVKCYVKLKPVEK